MDKSILEKYQKINNAVWIIGDIEYEEWYCTHAKHNFKQDKAIFLGDLTAISYAQQGELMPIPI